MFTLSFVQIQNIWRVLTLILFTLICLKFIYLSRQIIYRNSRPVDFIKTEFGIDICYSTNIENDKCYHTEDKVEYDKSDYECNFREQRIACYTKDFKNLNANEIIEKFKQCEISNLINIESLDDNSIVNQSESTYELYNGFICIKHIFNIFSNSQPSKFVITNNQFIDSFTSFLTLSVTYKDAIYKSKRTQFTERFCWNDQNSVENRCSESGKKTYYDLVLYSIKNLENPFISDCLIRKNLNQSLITQNDCYEECIKKEQKYYLLSYNENDKFNLDFNQTSNYLLDKCANLCYQDDCNTINFLVDNVYEEQLSENEIGSSIISLDLKEDRRSIAVPEFSRNKIIWLYCILIQMFFGFNFYETFLKVTNLYDQYSYRKKQIKSKKRFRIVTMFTIVGIILAFFFENFFFDYGDDSNRVFFQRESIVERDLSISICFDLCEIIKPEFKNDSSYENCDSQELINTSTLYRLEQITWNLSNFKANASMRNSVKVYPIRHDEFIIPYFYRNHQKCFLLFYQSKNQFPHLPMLKTSRVRINVTNAEYLFYIEDGYSFPKIDSKQAKFGNLHSVIRNIEKYQCKNYDNGILKTKDDHIQNCILQKSLKETNKIPTNINLIMNYESFNYLNLEFIDNKTELSRFLNECKNEFKENECLSIKTRLSHKYLYKADKDNISITLTPPIYDWKPVERENFLIILNRIFSFIMIFTGLSIFDFLKSYFEIYWAKRVKFYGLQLFRRYFYFGLFFVLLLHAFLLIFVIIRHSMLETSQTDFVRDFELPRIRVCYQMFDLYYQTHFNLKLLEEKTPKPKDILNGIYFYDDYNNRGSKITMDDFRFLNDTKEWNLDKNGLKGNLFVYYLEDLKCFNFKFEVNKTSRNLSVHYQRLYKLISFDFEKPYKDKNIFIFFNKDHELDATYNNPYHAANYSITITTIDRIFQDNYWHFKNFIPYFLDLICVRRMLNNVNSYLEYLREQFEYEQYSKITIAPLKLNDKGDDIYIRNRQFNFYIQFRSIQSNKNAYYFSSNYEKAAYQYSFDIQKKSENSTKLQMTINSNLIKIQEIAKNKYRLVELIVHLCILISFYFKFDVISLPLIMKRSYPFFKLLAIYTLYAIVVTLIAIFECCFKFSKFMKVRNEGRN